MTRARSAASTDEKTAVAVGMRKPTDRHGFPQQTAWETAKALRFCSDWQGKNARPRLQTEVRLLWTPETLHVRFDARYCVISTFADAGPSGRRDQLWDRDVVEVFLQPDGSDPLRYQEFEVSPNGFWIDLDIAPGEKRNLQSGLRRRARVEQRTKSWWAELALPMNCLVKHFDPAAIWRVNFFRVEGPSEPRFYSAWQPTGTLQPNFHVPEAFGRLVFAPARPPGD
jgi:alpha-galactosidase